MILFFPYVVMFVTQDTTRWGPCNVRYHNVAEKGMIEICSPSCVYYDQIVIYIIYLCTLDSQEAKKTQSWTNDVCNTDFAGGHCLQFFS